LATGALSFDQIYKCDTMKHLPSSGLLGLWELSMLKPLYHEGFFIGLEFYNCKLDISELNFKES